MNPSGASDVKPYQKSRMTAALRILAVIGIIIVVWVLILGYHVYDLSRVAREIQGQENIRLDYDWGGAIHRMNVDMNVIHIGLTPLYPVFRLFSDQSGTGHFLRQGELYLQFSVDLANCADTAFQGIQPILGMLQDSTASLDTGKVVEGLNNHKEAFHSAEALYQSAAALRPSLDPAVLPASFKKYYEKLDANFEWLGFGLKMLQALPGLAGVDRTQVYLVLAQNYDEIRATGGFISGIGTIEVDAGKIKKFELGDSYKIDDFSKNYPIPPMPIERFMLGGVWVTRDANWSPDFPTTAQKAQELFTLSTDVKTDGTIAFDQEAVRELVGIFGPFVVPSINFPITSENVKQYMQDAWSPDNPSALNREWWLHRKDFMKELGGELLSAMLECRDVNQLLAASVAIRDLIRAGHLLVYFNSPDVQSAFASLNLAGQVDFHNNPTFMLVDSNLGFNKMDGVIKRSLQIDLDIRDPSHPEATITIDYENPVQKQVECKHIASYGNGTYTDMQMRCYWDYWRVYLPAESRLVLISSPEIPPEWLLSQEEVINPVELDEGEGGSTVIGGMTVVPTHTNQQIVLKVSLPQLTFKPGQNGEKYLDFKIYKQPGLSDLPVTISVTGPPLYEPCPASNSTVVKTENQIEWKEAIPQTTTWNLCLVSNN